MYTIHHARTCARKVAGAHSSADQLAVRAAGVEPHLESGVLGTNHPAHSSFEVLPHTLDQIIPGCPSAEEKQPDPP